MKRMVFIIGSNYNILPTCICIFHIITRLGEEKKKRKKKSGNTLFQMYDACELTMMVLG